MSDKEKLTDLNIQLETVKQKHIDAEKKYNNLLGDINSKEDDISIAELDVNDAKNNLNLINASMQLKKSMIALKNNKNDKLMPILEFNILLHKTRQYSIQSIISNNSTRKLRKNITISPQDTFFKEQLMTSLDTATTHAKQSRIKIDKLHKLCTETSNKDIRKNCDNLKIAKSNAKNLEDNIIKIQQHYIEKKKAQEELKLIATTKTNTVKAEPSKPAVPKVGEVAQPAVPKVGEVAQPAVPKVGEVAQPT